MESLRANMNQYLMEGRYYQFVGRIREWMGTLANDEQQVEVGKLDQLVGRIAEHCRVPIEEADLLADQLSTSIHATQRENVEA
jgi:uncharacterized protein YjbJ (UPF0337 family)